VVYSALPSLSYWGVDAGTWVQTQSRPRMRWYSNRGVRSSANRKLRALNECRQSSRFTALFEWACKAASVLVQGLGTSLHRDVAAIVACSTPGSANVR